MQLSYQQCFGKSLNMQTIACQLILIFNRSCFTSILGRGKDWQNGACLHVMVEAEKDCALGL